MVPALKRALRAVLELQNPLELHFSENTIFCGDSNLERGHPIFKRLAEKMWRFGIAGITFETAEDEDLKQLISLLNYSERHHCSRQQFEERLQQTHFDGIRVLARDLGIIEPAASPVDSPERDTLWHSRG